MSSKAALPRLRHALWALIFVSLPLGAAAQGSPVLGAEILPGWTEPDGRRMAALRLELRPGWHTYWRIPGESGIAPRMDWSQSQNLAGLHPIWPRPQVFEQNGYVSYGYEDELILPLMVTPADPSRPVALIGALEIGVCRDTCVPADVSVMGALRGAGGPDPRIADALTRRERPVETAGLRDATCRVTPAERGAVLTLRATVPPLADDEHLLVDPPAAPLRVTGMRSWRDGGDLVAEVDLRAPEGVPLAIERNALAFTILTGDHMLRGTGCRGAP